jgi:HlyD family secretion protein
VKSIQGAGIVLVLAAFALGGCSSGGDATAPAAAPSQWLAVARGKVAVEGGMVLVAARTDGVVESVSVKQGDMVQAHEVMATLDPRAAKIAQASADAGVAQAKAQLAELQVSLKQAEQRAPRVISAY